MYKIKNDIPVFIRAYSSEVMYDLVDYSLLVLFNNNHLFSDIEPPLFFTGIALSYPEQVTLVIESLEFDKLNFFTLQDDFIVVEYKKTLSPKQPIATLNFTMVAEDKQEITFIPHYILKTK